MLILTRGVGEYVVIGDGIVVTLVSIDSGKTRIGIEAPRQVPVHREEIAERIAREREGRSAA